LRETGDDVLDVAPDAIVVVDERLPIHRRATLQGCDAMPATIAGSLRKCSDAGGKTPRDA